MSKFISRRLSGLTAYVPGEQPTDGTLIKLNTNESPHPPSPGVLAAISGDEVRALRLYPSTDGTRLLERLAAFYGVGSENVIIGNGSDELLAFAFYAFCDSERGVCFPDITYGFYPVYAELYGIPYRQIPLSYDLKVEPSDYFETGKNIVIANPNAPTGIALALPDIETIVRSNPDFVVIIDEAYVDFGAQSAIGLTRRYENLLVMHTYSKSRSLAGARLAYAIGNDQLIADLRKIKFSFNPYNVNRLTQLAGIAALDDDEYYVKMRHEIIGTREYASERMRRLGFETTPSSANFIFARHDKIGGAELFNDLRRHGFLVRHFDKPRISDYLRITVGTREQTEALICTLQEIIGRYDGEKQ